MEERESGIERKAEEVEYSRGWRLWEWEDRQTKRRETKKKGGIQGIRRRQKCKVGDGKRKGERVSANQAVSLSPGLITVAFVYHRASADSPPALQIKLTASATGIHYTRRAGS